MLQWILALVNKARLQDILLLSGGSCESLIFGLRAFVSKTLLFSMYPWPSLMQSDQ